MKIETIQKLHTECRDIIDRKADLYRDMGALCRKLSANNVMVPDNEDENEWLMEQLVLLTKILQKDELEQIRRDCCIPDPNAPQPLFGGLLSKFMIRLGQMFHG